MIRPAICTDKMLEFLDDLREGGTVNMFASWIELREHFTVEDLTKIEAREVMQYWMETFGQKDR